MWRMLGGGGSIQIARVFGIRIGASPSWFVVLFVLIYLLSDYFESKLGGSTTEAYLVAVAAVLLFFSSIVAARARPRARRAAPGDRHERHRPVVLRRHREAQPRHRVARRGVQDRRGRAGRDAPHHGAVRRPRRAAGRRRGARRDAARGRRAGLAGARAAGLPRAVERGAAVLQPDPRVPARRRAAHARRRMGADRRPQPRDAARGAHRRVLRLPADRRSASSSPPAARSVQRHLPGDRRLVSRAGRARGGRLDGLHRAPRRDHRRRHHGRRARDDARDRDGAARAGRVLPALPLGVVSGRRRRAGASSASSPSAASTTRSPPGARRSRSASSRGRRRRALAGAVRPPAGGAASPTSTCARTAR